MLRRRAKQGQSIIEYAALLMFVLIAFLIFQKYMVRGFAGRWKGVGDSLGGGQIYDPRKTLECTFDPVYTNLWYNEACYQQNCITPCLTVAATPADCTTCITGCVPPSGAEPNCD